MNELINLLNQRISNADRGRSSKRTITKEIVFKHLNEIKEMVLVDQLLMEDKLSKLHGEFREHLTAFENLAMDYVILKYLNK